MIKTKKTRHAWDTYAVFYSDKKIGHIIKEWKRDGYAYTPARELGREYISISGEDSAFTFDEAVRRLELSYDNFIEALGA